MKKKMLSVAMALVVLALSLNAAGIAGEKNKADAKCDGKGTCPMHATKASMTSKDASTCPEGMTAAQCAAMGAKCPMKATKASMTSHAGKMDCCQGKTVKATKVIKASNTVKSKKAVAAPAPNGTN